MVELGGVCGAVVVATGAGTGRFFSREVGVGAGKLSKDRRFR